jgi:glutamate synthase (NADPH/NADH) large chain
VKLVAEVGVGTVAAGVAKAKADVILISGHDGGTGASPLNSLKHAGAPWELGLAEAQQTLIANGLRDRVTVQVDGQLKTGRDVVIAALLGAEEYGFATAPLIVSGCVMMRVCHLDTCPVGIATQNPELRKRFTGQPEFVVNFFRFLAEEVREILASLGLRSLDEAIGRVDLIDTLDAVGHWKAAGLDLGAVLAQPELPEGSSPRRMTGQRHNLEAALDNVLIEAAAPALLGGVPVRIPIEVRNVNRSVGAMLGGEITRRLGVAVPDDTITVDLTGTAGQSFGAFAPRGLTLHLRGDANDYVAKGLSGAKITIAPALETSFEAEHQIIAGNTVLYGATAGTLFVRGRVGERFAVRNSGATAVVEGVGDHACEYMTGGTVLILGSTGRNVGAGMSAGHAYVLDLDAERVNLEMVDLDPPAGGHADRIRGLLAAHVEATGSTVAAKLLDEWPAAASRFTVIAPREYKKALANQGSEAEATEPAPEDDSALEGPVEMATTNA